MSNEIDTNVPNEVIPTVHDTTPAPAPKRRRGFAVMDPKRVSEIAAKGGVAAHVKGTAHEFTQDEAREAGRKGGYATAARRQARKDGNG